MELLATTAAFNARTNPVTSNSSGCTSSVPKVITGTARRTAPVKNMDRFARGVRVNGGCVEVATEVVVDVSLVTTVDPCDVTGDLGATDRVVEITKVVSVEVAVVLQ